MTIIGYINLPCGCKFDLRDSHPRGIQARSCDEHLDYPTYNHNDINTHPMWGLVFLLWSTGPYYSRKEVI